MKRLLNDFIGYLNITPQMLVEAESRSDKKLIVSGVLQRANSKNQNGRIYPREILEREAKKFQEKIDEGLSYGELDHPDSEIVELKNASHAIKELWWKEDDLMGKFEIFSTPAGNIARELIRCGMQLANSSRGVGSTTQNKEGADVVNEEYELITWDLVSNPSTSKAYLNAVNENKEYNLHNKIYAKINELIIDIVNNKI